MLNIDLASVIFKAMRTHFEDTCEACMHRNGARLCLLNSLNIILHSSIPSYPRTSLGTVYQLLTVSLQVLTKNINFLFKSCFIIEFELVQFVLLLTFGF